MNINNNTINSFEKLILDKLKIGLTQAEISNYLKEEKIKPNHIRSIEDRVRRLKERFGARTIVSLVYKLSKDGYI
ncbi:hypothetical protein AWE51_00135 [Aquimarina aggregata]|uniref:Transcriptional regulator n=1 Tax=Aquimarina aggregata TaxID=1642818 RepID=A0A162CVZ6_9FLAO|nr:hypothetical protein AWE51_00135 [Aquimarina aggregata]